MNNLHSGAKWLFRLQAYPTLIFLGFFITLFGSQVFYLTPITSPTIILIVAIIFYISFFIIISETYSRMSYNRWLYEITNEGIKIEKGIIWKKYTSIPYERIQNVDIRRGIIARIFGFSSLEIETAGQSVFVRGKGSNKKYHSEGYLPAVDLIGAEKIREIIMKKIRNSSNKSGF